MPVVAANPPALAASSKVEPSPADQLSRRDSRLVDCQHPIAEEDESTGTLSEPPEPTTPTSHGSDTGPFPNPLRHEESTDDVFVTPKASMRPADSELAASQPAAAAPRQPDTTREPPAPMNRTQSNTKAVSKSDPAPSSPPEKPHLGRRVGSFMRNRLHRAPSHKDGPSPPSNIQPEKAKNSKTPGPTSTDGQSEGTTPAMNIPRYSRRLSSFSISARNSPGSTQGHTPPSPGSPSSTISDEHAPLEKERSFTGHRHKHSTSSNAISSMDHQRPTGITWAGGRPRGNKRHTWTRRRSASTEQVPQSDSDDDKPTVGMMATFSRPANEGVGMKARRLSLSLPDEFVVDSCELDKEFKSSSLMPGRRGKCLGKGATAEVRIMARRGAQNGEDLVAVKEFRGREKGESEDEYIKKIKSEYSIAKSLHHPNIVETVRLCTNHGRWNHVMEYCGFGELFSLVERRLFSRDGGFYTTDDRLCFFKQLLRGVDYLHSHGIAHRDIKLENLLLNKEGHLKISDFGVAEVFCGSHPGMRAAGGECGKNMDNEIKFAPAGICGSLPYIAPEVLEKKGPYDPRPLDVWSCAIVFITMTFGGAPWEAAKTDYQLYAQFKSGWDNWLAEHPDGQITDGPDGHPACGRLFSKIDTPAIKRLLLKMLHPIPEKRITVREILNSAAIKGVACCCPESYEDPACCVDASKKKQTNKVITTKKYLHHHIPPKPENKVGKALSHRFDMGDGWR